jgi:hypothetical protein
MQGPRMRGPLRAFPKQQHTMNMVRHQYKGVELDLREVGGNLDPTLCHRLSRSAAKDDTVTDLAEKADMAAGTDGHEIGTGLRVIVPGEPQSPPHWFARRGAG